MRIDSSTPFFPVHQEPKTPVKDSTEQDPYAMDVDVTFTHEAPKQAGTSEGCRGTDSGCYGTQSGCSQTSSGCTQTQHC